MVIRNFEPANMMQSSLAFAGVSFSLNVGTKEEPCADPNPTDALNKEWSEIFSRKPGTNLLKEKWLCVTSKRLHIQDKPLGSSDRSDGGLRVRAFHRDSFDRNVDFKCFESLDQRLLFCPVLDSEPKVWQTDGCLATEDSYLSLDTRRF